jgi:hypothetical protein
MAGKCNIPKKVWTILHFKHLIMYWEVFTKHFELIGKKSDHIFKPWIFWKMAGKWNIPRKLKNILHFKHLIICRRVSIKHLEWLCS